MKTLSLSLVVILFSSVASAWTLSKNMTDHEIYQGSHCVAWTDKATYRTGRRAQNLPAGVVRLEIIAQEGVQGSFKQPFIQILVKKGSRISSKGFTLVATGKANKKLTLDLVKMDRGDEFMVFLGKLNERADMIQAIKDLNSLKVRLRDQKKDLGELNFSLRGSHRTVTQQFSDCELTLSRQTQPIE